MANYNSVRGMRDWWRNDVAKRRLIEQKAADIASCYGVSWVETPILEYAGVFIKTLGETSDVVGKEMYTLEDRKGDTLVMRPEGTAPVIRAILESGDQLPQKLLYTGPMFRYERPQKGRYRQFYQLGVEFLTKEPSVINDVECITLAHHIITASGIQNYNLHLGTLGSPEDRATYRNQLIQYLEPYKSELSTDSQKRLELNPLRILDSKNERDQEILTDAPRLIDTLSIDSRQFFNDVCQSLTDLGIPYIFDTNLVRGLDYYGHTTFEFKAPNRLGSQDAFGGGGRYDGLMTQMGSKQDACGIGWGLGLDRLMIILENEQQALNAAPVFIISLNEDAFCQKLTYQLRQHGIVCELVTGSTNVGKKMQQANKRGAAFALVVGDEERASQTVNVKNMITSTTHAVSIENLAAFLKENGPKNLEANA